MQSFHRCLPHMPRGLALMQSVVMPLHDATHCQPRLTAHLYVPDTSPPLLHYSHDISPSPRSLFDTYSLVMPFIGFYPSYRYRYGYPLGVPAYPYGVGMPIVHPPLVAHAPTAVPIPVANPIPVPVGVGMGMGMGYPASALVGYGYGVGAGGYGVPPPMSSGHVSPATSPSR